MEITLAFKKLSLVNGDEITLSIAPSAMRKMIMELIASGYITAEELAIYTIGQVRLCDQKHIGNVLPENVLNKLVSTYESVKNGETHV